MTVISDYTALLLLDVVAVLGGGWVGIAVTDSLHKSKGFWSRQIGQSRFRRANVPVGCALALLVAEAVPGRAAEVVRMLGLGMGISAVGWAWADPADSEHRRWP